MRRRTERDVGAHVGDLRGALGRVRARDGVFGLVVQARHGADGRRRHHVDAGRGAADLAGGPTRCRPARACRPSASRLRSTATSSAETSGRRTTVPRTWSKVTLPGPVSSLETSNGTSHAAVLVSSNTGASFAVYSTPVGHDTWNRSTASIPVGAGPIPSAQVVLHGSRGWILENDRVVVGGLRLDGGVWQSWTPRCKEAGYGTLAASSNTDLVEVCDNRFSGSSLTVNLYTSTDGGVTFSGRTVPHTFVAADQFGPVASPVRGTIALATVTNQHMTLIRTIDGGATWQPTWTDTSSNSDIVDLGFTTAVQGVAVVLHPSAAGSASSELLMTHDAGATWSVVHFPHVAI